MAEDSKPKRERLLSPKGSAVYPRLTVPDTKYNKDGEYNTGLLLSIDDASDLMADLDARVDAAFAKAIADNKGKTFKIVKGKKTDIVRNSPYVIELDEDGNETGNVRFNFTMKATFIDPKTKEVLQRKPTLVDGKGNVIKGRVNVYGGSIIKVNYTPSAYDSNFGVGVKLYLNAAQIIKLVTGGGSNHGFGADEDAEYEYEAPDNDSGFGNESSAEAPDEDEEDDQF
ncbi:hypothetical protein A7981_05535 [Methylovorus sp. MM2]|uniref:ssDNA-binding protein n=1 Tax=Methylovorus sp. MM2 TaxID=1848038 RepID=UPI0007E27D31|nr:ssDNA-binding protein [Methylovorus sp. MM2]OAM52900.1 hypothetical protein A7981_05535 [Methylovorus sp. MM2]